MLFNLFPDRPGAKKIKPFRNLPDYVPSLSKKAYDLRLMPKYVGVEDPQRVFHECYMKKMDNINDARRISLTKSLRWGRKWFTGLIGFSFCTYLYTIHTMQQEEFMEKFDKVVEEVKSKQAYEQQKQLGDTIYKSGM